MLVVGGGPKLVCLCMYMLMLLDIGITGGVILRSNFSPSVLKILYHQILGATLPAVPLVIIRLLMDANE